MLCRRKLELSEGALTLQQTLIRRQTLADCTTANELLDKTRAQAERLLRDATAQSAQLLESTRQAFLIQANAQLSALERDRQALYDNLENVAASIVQQAIRHVLEESIPEQRLCALLRELFNAHVPAVEATLLCNPSQYERVQGCLATYPPVPWNLQTDDTLETQALVLETADGNLRIDWDSMLGAIAPPAVTPVLPINLSV